MNEKDKEMIKKTETLVEEVTKDIESFRLHEAAQTLYHFTWHEFADVYIEEVKTRLEGPSYEVLLNVYTTLLKLLHPFMPFITEEVYQKLPGHEESIMIAAWPKT